MDAFHARAVDEDLDQRARRRQLVDQAAVDLERDPLLGEPVVGAQRAAHGIEKAPQDAVFVERGDGFQRDGEPGLDGLDARLAIRRCRRTQRWIEARHEELNRTARDRRVSDQRPLHIVLAERNAGLAQVFGVGA